MIEFDSVTQTMLSLDLIHNPVILLGNLTNLT